MIVYNVGWIKVSTDWDESDESETYGTFLKEESAQKIYDSFVLLQTTYNNIRDAQSSLENSYRYHNPTVERVYPKNITKLERQRLQSKYANLEYQYKIRMEEYISYELNKRFPEVKEKYGAVQVFIKLENKLFHSNGEYFLNEMFVNED